MRWARYVAHVKVMRNAYKGLAQMPERKRLFAQPKNRWEDTEKGLRKVICECKLESVYTEHVSMLVVGEHCSEPSICSSTELHHQLSNY
jgi:hypothetical protein